MHPVLFQFQTPSFLQGILGDTITIYTYGFLIALGTIFGFWYTARQAKKQFNLPFEDTQTLVLLILIAAIVGGKLFLFFESPQKYIHDPGSMLRNFGNGFVFYGSLLFAIPTMLVYFRIKKIPVLPMLDVMAITTCIVHGFGRMGCFMAGCCYGKPHEGILSVTFTDVHSQADPLNTPLYPTQLFSAGMIFTMLIILLYLKRNKQFHGQLFMTYLMLYAFGRSIVEIFRGDIERGFVIENIVSNSQFISILVFLGALFFYLRWRRTQKVAMKD